MTLACLTPRHLVSVHCAHLPTRLHKQNELCPEHVQLAVYCATHIQPTPQSENKLLLCVLTRNVLYYY